MASSRDCQGNINPTDELMACCMPVAVTILHSWAQDALEQYSSIFNWLLCLKRVALLMRHLWTYLGSLETTLKHPDQGVPSGTQGDPSQGPGQSQSGTQADPSSVRSKADLPGPVLQRLRTLQLFRHEAAHLSGVVQAYVQGQLLGKCWQQLQDTIKVALLAVCAILCSCRELLVQQQKLKMAILPAKDMFCVQQVATKHSVCSLLRHHGSSCAASDW